MRQHDWLPEEAENRTEISYPLNNRWYTAKYPQAFNSTRTNGVFSMDNNLSLRPAGGLRVNLGPGLAWLSIDRFKGVVYAQTDDEGITFDVPPPHGNLVRRDRVAIRFDYILNDIFADYHAGIPGMPAPTIQRDTEAHELHLYEIVVAAGTLEIRNDMILDLRMNETLCGIMRDSVTGIPTQILYDAWWAWFQKTTDAADEFMLWMNAFRQQNESDFNTWLNDFKNRADDGFSTWLINFQSSTVTEVNEWYTNWRNAWIAAISDWFVPWRDTWEDDVQLWFDELQIVLEGDVATSLANKIMQHENRTVADNGGVHGIKYESGVLMVLTDEGWAVVGGAQIGFTAQAFDSRRYTALAFDLKRYTAYSFDNAPRTIS